MVTEWEYTVVPLPQGGNTAKTAVEQTELINRVAAQGWRLVTVGTGAGPVLLAYFERKASTRG